MVIIGLDPGTKNFGWCAIRFNSKTFQPLGSGKIINTVQDINSVQEQTLKFCEEILSLISKYKPSAIIVERFLNRGRFNGATGEYVSMMIGILSLLTRSDIQENLQPSLKANSFNMHIIHSGTWKTAINRKGKVKNYLKQMYDYCLAEPHELDAYLIGHYGYSIVSQSSPYSHLNKGISKKDIRALEAVATGKKKRCRK